MENIVVTAITDNKDKLRDDQNTKGAMFIAFTDQLSAVWKVIPPYSLFKDPVRNSRIHRALIHQFIDADYSLWIDGNIALKVPMEQLIEEWMGDYDMAVFGHPSRDCLYDEGEACMHRDDRRIIEEELRRYRKEGYKEHQGLAEVGVMLRKHSKKMEAFNNAWWSQICRYSQRDQISFPYVAQKVGIKVNDMGGNVRKHPYFSYSPHLKIE